MLIQLIPAESANDSFAQVPSRLAEDRSPQTFLEIGAANGGGSTPALSVGMRPIHASYAISALDLTLRDACAELRRRY